MIDGFVLHEQVMNQIWFYHQGDIWVKVNTSHNLVEAYDRSVTPNVPVMINLDTLNNLMADAKGRVKWN